MKILIPENLKVIIDTLVTEFPSDEWTMIGKTQYDKGNIRLLDLRAVKQNSTGGTTVMTADEEYEFIKELKKDHENPKNWNLWMHSHNTMGAFWSGTDTQNFKDWNKGQDYMVHVVVSTRGYKGALTQYKPFEITNDDVEIEFEPFILPEEPREIAELKISRKNIYDKWKTVDDKIKEWEESVKAPNARKMEELKKELKDKNIVTKYTNDNKWNSPRVKYLETATKNHKYTCKCKLCKEYYKLLYGGGDYDD